MQRKHGLNECCLKAQESLLTLLRSEIKEAQNLMDFSKTVEEFQLLIDLMKKEPIRNERKLPLKYGVGCKTCKLKNDAKCQEYKKLAAILYEETD